MSMRLKMNFFRYVGKNLKNAKIILAFFIIGIWSFLCAQDYVTGALMMGNSLNVLEPSIYLLSNKGVGAFLFILCFIFAFSDIPFEDGILTYYVYRRGYIRWYLNILLFVVFVSFAFVILPVIISALVCAKEGFLSFSIWSQSARLSANGGAPQLNFIPEIPMNFLSYEPIKVLLFSSVLTFLHCALIAILLLSCNCISKKLWGIMAVTSLETSGFMLSILKLEFAKILPFLKASFSSQTGFINSLLYFGIAILVLFILNLMLIKNYRFESGEAK